MLSIYREKIWWKLDIDRQRIPIPNLNPTDGAWGSAVEQAAGLLTESY